MMALVAAEHCMGIIMMVHLCLFSSLQLLHSQLHCKTTWTRPGAGEPVGHDMSVSLSIWLEACFLESSAVFMQTFRT